MFLYLLCTEDNNGVMYVEHVTHNVSHALEYIRCDHFKRNVITMDVHDDSIFDDRILQTVLRRRVDELLNGVTGKDYSSSYPGKEGDSHAV